MKSVLELGDAKRQGRRIVMVTAYDAWTARAVGDRADCLLVGDSVMMVLHGEADTLRATPELMALHTQAVTRGNPQALVIADMPFLSTRQGTAVATACAGRLVQAGAAIVKIEGAAGNLDIIRHLVESGLPVMGHLGLTPQSYRSFGGYKVQGRAPAGAARILADSAALEEAGCCGIVLECVPRVLAGEITAARHIPVIGIGAGADCDGQVLVLHDLLGFLPDFQPRFARRFAEGAELVGRGVEAFAASVRDGTFPTAAESFE